MDQKLIAQLTSATRKKASRTALESNTSAALKLTRNGCYQSIAGELKLKQIKRFEIDMGLRHLFQKPQMQY